MDQNTRLEADVLFALSKNCDLTTLELAHMLHCDHQLIVGIVKSLIAYNAEFLETEICEINKYNLTPEGAALAQRGSHETIVWNNVPVSGEISKEKLKELSGGSFLIGFGKALQNKWLTATKKEDGTLWIERKASSIYDETQVQLQAILNNNDDKPCKLSETEFSELKKRKLATYGIVKYYKIRRGKNFAETRSKLEPELTADMLANNLWQNLHFKPYNFDALGIVPTGGHLHPLLKVKSELKEIFIELGFQEMSTNRYVESSFWNFDALFQAQMHPARDIQDTFFMKDPARCRDIPKDLCEQVKKVHEIGDFGSRGYQYSWKYSEAEKNILRTHTTAISTRMLHKLANEGKFQPCKLFSIDRVFRNEATDATHLAEFHQVEGLVADYKLTLEDLMNVLYEFFARLGMSNLKFKPAYNPYTEPSMEIFGYHDGLSKWVEIGNSGVFRPEMLRSLGLPEDVCVIAWGLSLERPTMIKYKLSNIRDLFGHKVDLRMIHNNPICRLNVDNKELEN